MKRSGNTGQEAAVAFLSDPRNWPNAPRRIERHETHISRIFLGGNLAFKMKKAVRLPYLDFSTLRLRERFCRRELEINSRFSPQLYLGLSRMTRDAEGRLHLDGPGDVEEWLVRMRRFDQEDILSSIAARGPLTPALIRSLAHTVADSHRKAAVHGDADGYMILARTLEELEKSSMSRALPEAVTLLDHLAERTERFREMLKGRGGRNAIRRCHGDLHLGNIVLWRGRPLLFDAIEFSEELATVDVLHDLAFLLMDLVHRGRRKTANRLMNLWLQFMHGERHHEALGLTGLYVAFRAAIRAMVSTDLAMQKREEERRDLMERAQAYLRTAEAALRPVRPRVVAIGGLSGSGKTTLAARLAPFLAPGPGAAHYRSDVERKIMAGKDEFTRLGPEFYTQEISDEVYARIISRAAETAASGWVAVVDAVFLKARERRAVAAAAARAGAEFAGIWLDAPPETLKRRVEDRRHDASDATTRVVEMQLALQAEVDDWPHLSATGSPDEVLKRATDMLGISF